MSKKCILSKAQASSATRLWIMVKFVNSSALPGTVLGKRTKMLVKGVQDQGITVLIWVRSLGFLCFFVVQVNQASDSVLLPTEGSDLIVLNYCIMFVKMLSFKFELFFFGLL